MHYAEYAEHVQRICKIMLSMHYVQRNMQENMQENGQPKQQYAEQIDKYAK